MIKVRFPSKITLSCSLESYFCAFGENVSGSLLLRIGNKLLRIHFEFIYEIKRCLLRFASTKQACVDAKILIKRLVKLKKKFLNATK